MVIFSSQPLKKWFFLIFFRHKPPPNEMSKCNNAPVLQWILKDYVYFPKITENWIWRNPFIVKKYRVFTQHAAVAIMRHSAIMALLTYISWGCLLCWCHLWFISLDYTLPSQSSQAIIWIDRHLNCRHSFDPTPYNRCARPTCVRLRKSTKQFMQLWI